MKIIFYISNLKHGGAERVMANLANEMHKRNNNVIFITSSPTKNEYKLNPEIKRLYLEEEDSNYGFLKRNFLRIKNLRKICKSEKADIIISFMAEPNFRTIIATRFLKIKSVVSVRNDPYMEYRNRITRVGAKFLYMFSNGCVFQTDDAMKFFPKAVQNKSRIIFNPVNKKFYKTMFDGVRKDIVTVGRLEAQKNHELLIKAFSKIAYRHKNENLLIYGSGSKEKQLSDLINTLEMQNRIFLMGEHDEINKKIKSAKLFVLSSDYEGMPNVLMEAMALGLPVVSTNCPCGGPKLLLNNDECGALVNVNDESGLTEMMDALLNNSLKLNELSINAKKRAKEFAPNKIYNQWESYLKSL